MRAATESELLTRCLQGHADAWDELFDKHYDAMGRFVFQLAPDFSREDVEEICQEALLTVIRCLGTFHGNSQFQTWLFRIAANKAHDYRERQRAAKRGGGQAPLSLNAEDPNTGLAIDAPSDQPGPDAALLQTEQTAWVGHALEALANPCREIIELRYFSELSYEEIGRALRLNAKTVSSRLSRCLDRLEAILRAMESGEKATVSRPIGR